MAEERDGPISILGTTPGGVRLEMRCGACGAVGTYSVGRFYVDTDVLREGPDALDRAWGFSAYLTCASCDAGGPWELTPDSRAFLVDLLRDLRGRMARGAGDEGPLIVGRSMLFDGTIFRWPTEGEAHLKGLMDGGPDDYYLWDRLGNLLRSAGEPARAEEAYREALKRNENDLESYHSLAGIALERGDEEQADEYLWQLAQRVRNVPARTPPDVLLAMLENTLDRLVRAAERSGKVPLPEGVELDLDDPDDRQRLLTFWMTGQLPDRARTHAGRGRPALRTPPRPRVWTPSNSTAGVGRNDPCPCGSGRKFKKCCGAR